MPKSRRYLSWPTPKRNTRSKAIKKYYQLKRASVIGAMESYVDHMQPMNNIPPESSIPDNSEIITVTRKEIPLESVSLVEDRYSTEMKGSTIKCKRLGESSEKASSSRQRSDEEDSSFQPHLAQTALFDSKSRNDKRDSFLPDEMSKSSMEVLSPRPDPLEIKFNQPSTADYFVPSNSADTEDETSLVGNQSQPFVVVNDAYTKFFLCMADTVRDLPPDLQIIAKRNVLHEVTECELTALNRLNVPKP